MRGRRLMGGCGGMRPCGAPVAGRRPCDGCEGHARTAGSRQLPSTSARALSVSRGHSGWV
jgi:hypothetical protein